MKTKMNLYIWDDFQPDYTGGLAFAIAGSEDAAKRMVARKNGTSVSQTAWGKLTVRPVNKRVARCVVGSS